MTEVSNGLLRGMASEARDHRASGARPPVGEHDQQVGHADGAVLVDVAERAVAAPSDKNIYDM